MATIYRPCTDGAAQAASAYLNAIASMLTTGTKSTVDPSSYDDKKLLTEETGREIATRLGAILNALETYSAPSAKKVAHKFTVGTAVFDGSADISANEATELAAGLLSAANQKKLNAIEAGAQKNTITGVKGDKEDDYRKGNVNLTPANIGAEPAFTKNTAFNKNFGISANTVCQGNDSRLSDTRDPNPHTHKKSEVGLGSVDNVKQYSASNPPPYPVTKVNKKTGEVTITLAELMGENPIGDAMHPLYWNGTIFVPQEITVDKMSFGDISAAGKEGTLQKYLRVGDVKPIELTNGEHILCRLLGFDHDDLVTGGKAPSTWKMSILKTKYPMNSSATNVGGWDQSIMRTKTMQTILNTLLPYEVRAFIQTVNKKTTAGNKLTTINTSQDDLFLFSCAEVDKAASSASVLKDEGTTYEYWLQHSTNADRIERIDGTASVWWLRSPGPSDAAHFCCIRTGGGNGGSKASNSCGVGCGFCI